MSWLDAFKKIIGTVQSAGMPAPQRPTINFVSGATVTDDPINNATLIAINGGIPAGTTFAGNAISWSLTTLFNGMSATATVAIAGAAIGNHVLVTPPGDWPAGMTLSGSFVSALNTVTLVASNVSGSNQNIPILSTDPYVVRVVS